VNHHAVTDWPAALQALFDAKAHAEAANAAKSLLLATISHEIRTPLYGMLASIELIGKTRLDALQMQLADAMACSAHTLKNVLDDALDFAKTEAGTETVAVAYREFDLCRDIESAVQGFAARAALKNLQLHCVLDPALAGLWWGDALKLTQILNNLINNAVKFTLRGSVTIAGKLIGEHADSGASHIELFVRDTGPGVAAENTERIFNLFEQADNPGSALPFSGSGLGLFICRKSATAMGGSIDLVSSPGSGSTFTLRFLLTRSGGGSPRMSNAPSPKRESLRKTCARVLIVDDQPINLLLLEKQLNYFGCHVTTAASGAEALAHGLPAGLNSGLNFDLILTDLNLPDIDGCMLARSWRADGMTAPIVAITGRRSADEYARCLAAGMNGYLLKPFTMEELGVILACHVGLHCQPSCEPPFELPAAKALQSLSAASYKWRPEMMRLAAAAITNDLAALAQCAAMPDAGKNREKLGKLIHRIHGGMAALDMRPAAALCRAIEESIEFEWMQEVRRLTPVLQDMLLQIREDIDPGEDEEIAH
jgi:two-component system, NarL family, capsular synthesis sensor histidine kinase RcsC